MKFWIVWNARLWNGNSYDSYARALKELRELEKNNPGVKFYVMRSVDVEEHNE